VEATARVRAPADHAQMNPPDRAGRRRGAVIDRAEAMERSQRLEEVRLLSLGDLRDVVELQAAVTAGLPPGFVRAKCESDLRSYLDGTRGIACGVGCGGELLGAALLRVPRSGDPNRGAPFPLVPAEDWPHRACFLESAMVRPDARGRGYQRALFEIRREQASRVAMRWICAGVRLENEVSWRNLLARGLAIVGIRFDLGGPVIGLLRSCDGSAPACAPGDEQTVAVDDAARHEAVLADGYLGVGLTADRQVIYRRRITAPEGCRAA
jgi:hypothetical protein